MKFKKISLSGLSPIKINTLIILLAFGFQKACTLVRDILLVNYFGVTQNLDAYFYALMIPLALFNIVSGSFNYFFVPAYWNIKINNPSILKSHLFSLFFYTAIILLALSLIYGAVFPPVAVFLNKNLFSSAAIIDCFSSLSGWASVFLFFYALSSFFATLMQAEHHYAFSLLPQSLIPVSSIIFVVFGYHQWGIHAAMYGVALGAIVNFIVMWIYCVHKKLFSLSFPIADLQRTCKSFNIDQFWALIFSFVLSSFVLLIDQHMASTFGHGQLTILNYGMALPDGLASVLSVALGTAVFSYFSQWIEKNEKKRVVEASRKAILYLVLFLIPACSLFSLNADLIISVFYKRGVFSELDVAAVSKVFSCYVFNVISLAIVTTGVRIVSAMKHNLFHVKVGVFLIVSKVILNVLFVQFFGFVGIPLATLVTFACINVLIFSYLHRQGYPIFNDSFIHKFMWCAITCLFISFILMFIDMSLAAFGIYKACVEFAVTFGMVFVMLLVSRRLKVF